MPCCGICGNQGHNRRTCRQWQILEATRRAEAAEEEEMSVIHTPQGIVTTHGIVTSQGIVTDIHFNINYTPSTRNRRPVTPTAPITPTADTSVSFETPNDRVSRSLFEELDNVDFNALFLDTDSDLDSLPGLISTDSLDDSMDKMVYPPLVSCVEEPCQTHDCPICMEDLKQTDLLITRCGHQFHGTCMLQHMKKHDNCPMCRGVLFTKAITM